MALTVLTWPTSQSLTTRARVKAVGNIKTNDSDDVIDRNIIDASAAIVSHCGREFARALVRETLAADGGLFLSLSRRPVAAVSSAAYRGDAVTSVVIDDADAGLLYREQGFIDSHATVWGLDRQEPQNAARPDWTIEYAGGWLLPADDLVGLASDVSVAAADKSFNSIAGRFPATLQPGDTFVASGFANSSNNARHTVVTATASKITTTSTLTTEAEAADRAVSLLFANLPGDIDRACALTVIDWLRNDSGNELVTGKTVGDTSITYARAAVIDDAQVIPSRALALLRRYRAIEVA